MAKSSGLGMNHYQAGYDLSDDIGSFAKIGGGPALLDVTPINKLAFVRLGGLRNGEVSLSTFHDPTAGQEHTVFSALPTGDQHSMTTIGTSIGSAAACMVGKQTDYDPTRAANGMLTFKVDGVSNGYGLEWGVLLTAGLRTDTAATNGTSLDGAAASTFGAQAYLQLTAFTGTDVTVKLQDSADNSTFADISGMAFTQVTAAHKQQRIATVNTATIRRYVRAVTVTTGGFTSATFAVALVRNQVAGQVF